MIRPLFLVAIAALLSFGNRGLAAQNFNEVIKAVASDRAASDRFGWSVSISGDYAIVGAVVEDEDAAGGGYGK